MVQFGREKERAEEPLEKQRPIACPFFRHRLLTAAFLYSVDRPALFVSFS